GPAVRPLRAGDADADAAAPDRLLLATVVLRPGDAPAGEGPRRPAAVGPGGSEGHRGARARGDGGAARRPPAGGNRFAPGPRGGGAGAGAGRGGAPAAPRAPGRATGRGRGGIGASGRRGRGGGA